MSYRIEYHPSVETEIRAIFDWYKERSLAAGINFLTQFKLTEKAIQKNPLAYLIVSSKGIRRAVIRKFPYKAYFRPVENVIYILAVIHFSRSNRYVGRRLKK